MQTEKATTKGINPQLVRINTDPKTYYPCYVIESTGELIEASPVDYVIGSNRCFEVVTNEYDFDVYRATRIAFNDFFVERFQVRITQAKEVVNWTAATLNGASFCPLLLQFAAKEIPATEFHKMILGVFRRLWVTPPDVAKFRVNKP